MNTPLDHLIVLLRVLMLAAKRYGFPGWTNPADPGALGWPRVREWVARIRAQTESSATVAPSMKTRVCADLDAWLALFDRRPETGFDGSREALARVLLPAAFTLGWRADEPDPEASPDRIAGDKRWDEVREWVECHRDTSELEGEAGALAVQNCAAWLALYQEARS